MISPEMTSPLKGHLIISGMTERMTACQSCWLWFVHLVWFACLNQCKMCSHWSNTRSFSKYLQVNLGSFGRAGLGWVGLGWAGSDIYGRTSSSSTACLLPTTWSSRWHWRVCRVVITLDRPTKRGFHCCILKICWLRKRIKTAMHVLNSNSLGMVATTTPHSNSSHSFNT